MGRMTVVEKSNLNMRHRTSRFSSACSELSLQMKAVCVCHLKLLLMSPHFQSSYSLCD